MTIIFTIGSLEDPAIDPRVKTVVVIIAGSYDEPGGGNNFHLLTNRR